MIDPRADRAVHRQLADLLRHEIAGGRYAPGEHLPGELRLAQEHGVGRDTVRAALAILRAEGIVSTRPPYGTRVRELPSRESVRVPRGSRVLVRMPTPDEVREHDLDEGVPMIELHQPGGRLRILAADRVELTFS